jgi:preprotein translocase subunit SecF
MRLLKLIPDQTNFDFVGARYVAFAFDGLLILITVLSLYFQGLNLGLDFTGGILVEVKGQETVDIGAMRERVDTLGFGEAQLQYFNGGDCAMPADSCVLIRVQPEDEASGPAAAQAIQAVLGEGYEFRRVDVVGPKVSGELFQSGVLATLFAIIMIAGYVAFRFEWQFGVGAMISTGHDVFVTLGLYSLLQMDFSLTSVAVLLTLAGYSVNDTVVVFDRIRENRRRFKRMELKELINLSINQTLSRTVLTGTTTMIALIPLMVFGGPTLFEFSAAILFGIVIGTFSSVYVAGTLLIYLPPLSRSEEQQAVPAE